MSPNQPVIPPDAPPNAARIYDYTLGGTFNVEADRQAAEAMFQLLPSTAKWVKMLRAFLKRAARDLHAQGFTQYLDLGSGLPTQDHIHSVAPDATVVYVDIDPVTVEYGTELLAEVPTAHYMQGDVREIEQILESDVVKAHIDLNKKVAIGLNGVTVFMRRPEITHLAKVLHDWAPAGSMIYVTFETKGIGKSSPAFEQMMGIFAATGSPMYLVSLEENMEMMKPWRTVIIDTLADYLELPIDHITEADREGVELEFYAALLGKQDENPYEI